MNEGLIPQRYAKALMKLAQEKGVTAPLYEEMKTLAQSFAQNPSLQKVVSNPFVGRDEKVKLLISAAGGQVKDEYRSFVNLILDRKRADLAYLMALSFCDLYRKDNKIAQVRIITAASLGDSELAKIKKVVADAFHGMTLEYTFQVDPDLIGGFVIDVEGQRLDASISNEIEQLRLKLLSSN